MERQPEEWRDFRTPRPNLRDLVKIDNPHTNLRKGKEEPESLNKYIRYAYIENTPKRDTFTFETSYLFDLNHLSPKIVSDRNYVRLFLLQCSINAKLVAHTESEQRSQITRYSSVKRWRSVSIKSIPFLNSSTFLGTVGTW